MATMKTLVTLALVWFCQTRSANTQVSNARKEKDVFTSDNKGTYASAKVLEGPHLFSPRMDYDEWTPLGRGDPLKNDPTYDYVPPVLERVHYWMDPSKRTPDPPRLDSGVLVLGSRTESTFAVTRPAAAATAKQQGFASDDPPADSRIDASSFLDPFFKLADFSQFNLNFDYGGNGHRKPSPDGIRRPTHGNKQRTQPPHALQRPPHTMLMPPPPPPPVVGFTASQAATVSAPPTARPATNSADFANAENAFKPVAISMPGRPENETENKVKATLEFWGSPARPATERTATSPFENHGNYVTERETWPQRAGEQKPKITTHLERDTTTVAPLKKEPGKGENISSTNRGTELYNDLPKRPSETALTPSKDFDRFNKKQSPWKTENDAKVVNSYQQNDFRKTTTTPSVTTTSKIDILTTDPMFKHYKQPSEPVRGPFYLIIQGHSKVKTYGASKNPINRLLTSNEIKYDDDDDDDEEGDGRGNKRNGGKFERKTRKLRYFNRDAPIANNDVDSTETTGNSTGENGLESLEETFGKSNGGSSKKRYLGSRNRRKRFVRDEIRGANRRLLSEETNEDEPDNIDLEGLVAIGDDYDPADVTNILLKRDGNQGSGFGNFAMSVFGKGENEVEDDF